MSTLTRRTLPTVLAAMSARALVQDTEPLRPNLGAIWFDTTVGALKVWDGTSWTVAEVDTSGIADGAVDDTKIADGTISESKLSFVLPDGTTTVTVAATAPTSPNVDDLWIDTSSGSTIKRWDGSAWVAYQFGTAAIADGAIDDTKVSFVARDIGGVTTFTQGTTPTGAVAGDLWIDTANGNVLKRYDGTTWTSFQDAAIATAQSAADAAQTAADAAQSSADDAQTTADGKNRIFRQGTTPTADAVGDVWFDTANGNRVSVWDGTSWVTSQLQGVAVGNLDAGSITTGSLASARIAAGTITASQIAADTITASQIAAGAISTSELAALAVTAAKIAANTITASQIAAGTITATEIAAGTITATELAADSVDTAQIVAGAVTAAEIAAGTIVAGIVDATTITGAQFIATGTQGEMLVYNGTPAAGNLILAVSGQNTTDAFGNTIKRGLTLGGFSGAIPGDIVFDDGLAGTTTLAQIIAEVGVNPNSRLHVLGPKSSHTTGLGTLGPFVSLGYDHDASAADHNVSIGVSGTTELTVGLGTVDLVGNVTINGEQAVGTPAGVIQMYGGATAPSGWLPCDGSSVLRATYPSLFAAIGTTYGSVDATHFTLPDFGGKFPRGNTPGTGGGADTHTHPLSDNAQAQINIAGGTKTNVREVTTPSFNATDGVNGTSTSAGNSQVRGAALRGDTDSASNVPAYTGVNFIIKT